MICIVPFIPLPTLSATGQPTGQPTSRPTTLIESSDTSLLANATVDLFSATRFGSIAAIEQVIQETGMFIVYHRKFSITLLFDYFP